MPFCPYSRPLRAKRSAMPSSFRQAADFVHSISPDAALIIEQTAEIHSFLESVELLKRAYHEILALESAPTSLRIADGSNILQFSLSPGIGVNVERENEVDEESFLQQHTSEELLEHILQFLDSVDLALAGSTSLWFHDICRRHVDQRCPTNIRRRQLETKLQLLRCAEQMDGDCLQSGTPHVPFPILLPERRIVVSSCGDADYNGVYLCTDCNCNGFVFSKPRSRRRRVVPEEAHVGGASPSGQLLRCFISKRFSGAVRNILYCIVFSWFFCDICATYSAFCLLRICLFFP